MSKVQTDLEDDMEDQNTPIQPAPQATGSDPRQPRRLLRSRQDRVIAGVAGGLGRYFSVDPVIFRIGFAVSVFFGGLGALAYIALALFVPDDEGGRAPVGVQNFRIGGQPADFTAYVPDA